MKKEKDRKMLVGVVWNCAAELKFILTAILFLFTLISILQFMPISFSSNLSNNCVSNISSISNIVDSASASISSPPPSPPPVPPAVFKDEVLENGVIKRVFNPFGSAAYNFILMSAYRGGIDTFAVMGLASKPLHVYGKPSYQCEWIPNNMKDDEKMEKHSVVSGTKILPDWGYGRVYTVLVINCTFPIPVGDDGNGGKLLIHATTNGGGDSKSNTTDTFLALTEPEKYFTIFTSTVNSPPKYDFLYCGSSLYGDLSPQRIREWLAFHVRLFGVKSHFVIHDAGGVHEGVMAVLKPWIEKGYVTLEDIRDQERFDGYYHNQFLIVNDCLHKYRFQAKWMFFFDVDEFIFVPKKSTIKSLVESLSDYTQFTIEQMPMSNRLCLEEDRGKSYRKWGFEKLVYKDVKRGIRRDRKYAVQPRNVIATGVHMSQNTVGKTTHKTEGRIKYFHYHGTIAQHREPCRQLVNATKISVDRTPYEVDTTMREIAGTVKRFELKTIGSILQKTRQ